VGVQPQEARAEEVAVAALGALGEAVPVDLGGDFAVAVLAAWVFVLAELAAVALLPVDELGVAVRWQPTSHNAVSAVAAARAFNSWLLAK